MTVAGLAMCVAVGAIYVATRFTRNQLSGVYVIIIVVGYMLKDRMKEWGKRYLQPAAMKFGFEFPDRTVKVQHSCFVLVSQGNSPDDDNSGHLLLVILKRITCKICSSRLGLAMHSCLQMQGSIQCRISCLAHSSAYQCISCLQFNCLKDSSS